MTGLKVAFIASLYEKETRQLQYEAIVQLLEQLGHTVLHQHITNFDLHTISSSDQQNTRFHESVLRAVKSADIIVAEITRQSIGVGYTLSEALKNHIPVLALTTADAPPLTAFLEDHSLLCVHQYHTTHQLQADLPFLISQLEPRKAKKFNVFLPLELDAYLLEVSAAKNLSKSEYLRQLLEHDRRDTHVTERL